MLTVALKVDSWAEMTADSSVDLMVVGKAVLWADWLAASSATRWVGQLAGSLVEYSVVSWVDPLAARLAERSVVRWVG